MAMMFSLLLALQAASAPPSTESRAVLAPINRLFESMQARDADKILSQVRAEGRATGVSDRGISGRSWTEFADRFRTSTGPKLEERLVGAPTVKVDGDIAMVWADYVFHIDGKFSHCGVDHFDLVREGGVWKILNITWTQRTTACPKS